MNTNKYFTQIFENNHINAIYLYNEFNNRLDKDFDFICKINDRNKIVKLLKKNKFKKLNIRTFYNKNHYLYGALPYDTYTNNKITFDIAYELSFESLDNQQYIPLDIVVQEYLWRNLIDIKYYKFLKYPSYEIQFIYFLCKSIYTKKSMNDHYKKIILNTYPYVDKILINIFLSKIFFKFSDTLVMKIKSNDILDLYNTYLKFKEY